MLKIFPYNYYLQLLRSALSFSHFALSYFALLFSLIGRSQLKFLEYQLIKKMYIYNNFISLILLTRLVFFGYFFFPKLKLELKKI